MKPNGNTGKNYSNPQSSLHPPYITFFPLLGNIHLSLDYESPQNFLASPLEPKNTNHSSHMLSPTIRLFFQYLLFFCVCVCLFAFYNFVQPLAFTFNKRYIVISSCAHLQQFLIFRNLKVSFPTSFNFWPFIVQTQLGV